MGPIRKPFIALLAAAMVFAAAGCGGDDGDGTTTVESDRDGIVTETEAEREDDLDDADDSDEVTEDDDDTDDDERGGSRPSGTGAFASCMELYGVMGSLFLGPALAMGLVPPEEMAELEAQMEELEAQVPAAIEDDYDVVRGAFEQLYAEMGALDFEEGDMSALMDPEVAERMERASEAMETDEFEQAMANIESYIEAECGDLNGF